MKRPLMLLLLLAVTPASVVVGCKMDGVKQKMANTSYLPGSLRGLPPQHEPEIEEAEDPASTTKKP